MASLLISIRQFFGLLAYRVNVRYWSAIIIFALSNAVGASVDKMYVRYRDLKMIVDSLQPNSQVLEFGSGFSTIFLSYSPIAKIISIEEHKRFVPKLVNIHKSYIEVVPTMNTLTLDGEISKKHQTHEYLLEKKFDFIYIDGPETPKTKNGHSAANVDVFELEVTTLQNTIIGVDIRINTCISLHQKLIDTHKILVSKKLIKVLSTGQVAHPFISSDLMLNKFRLKLTTLFVPIMSFDSTLEQLKLDTYKK